jgi:hypothetical protein
VSQFQFDRSDTSSGSPGADPACENAACDDGVAIVIRSHAHDIAP